jgi:hypothetical protein
MTKFCKGCRCTLSFSWSTYKKKKASASELVTNTLCHSPTNSNLTSRLYPIWNFVSVSNIIIKWNLTFLRTIKFFFLLTVGDLLIRDNSLADRAAAPLSSGTHHPWPLEHEHDRPEHVYGCVFVLGPVRTDFSGFCSISHTDVSVVGYLKINHDHFRPNFYLFSIYLHFSFSLSSAAGITLAI